MKFELNKKYYLVMFDKNGRSIFDTVLMSLTLEHELKTLYEYVSFNRIDEIYIYDEDLYRQSLEDNSIDMLSDSFIGIAKVHHLGGKNYILEWR
ncbi:MAG: hypothetical protein [Microviridae sp.]|nr:MAG: hypothetical protein [Microviridae sp.]